MNANKTKTTVGCKFCKVNEWGDSQSAPLIQEYGKFFSKELSAEVQVYSNRLSLYIGSEYDIFLDKDVKIKFCPMCGRRLED